MSSDSYPAESLLLVLQSATTPSGNLFLLVLYMLLALVISHVCSILESVLLSTPMSYVNTLELQGKKGVKLLKKIKGSQDRPICAILVINTIANTVGASLVGSEATGIFSSTGVGIISGIFTFCVLFFSEIIPKTIGATYWRKLALPASRIIHFFIFLTYPLVIIIERFQHLISRGASQVSVSREDVAAMVTTGAEEGVLEKDENKMIQNLLKLDQFTAHQIMTPSSVVTMAESSQTIHDFYHSDEFGQFSRIPLYEAENDEYITGYVLKQEILERLAEDKFDIRLKELERPILSFLENETVSNIWERLLETKEHISVIIDEYGSMRGIVTMEDVIETMLGYEIVDEKDEVVDMQELAKAQWKQVQKKQKRIEVKAERIESTPDISESANSIIKKDDQNAETTS